MDFGENNEIKASIDIGSNTVLLLAGSIQDERVIPLVEKEEAPRLGKGVDSEKRLDPAAVQRVIDALLNFKIFLGTHYPGVQDIQVMATSAVRDARDKKDFVERIENETGFHTRVLTGEEEARLMYYGAISTLPDIDNKLTVLDIGGGSTEVATGTRQNMVSFHSFNMGAVRFTERYLSHNPPTEKEIINCRQAIAQMLQKRNLSVDNKAVLIGIAGTLTSLASIDAGLQTYQPSKLDGYKMALSDVSEHVNHIARCTKEHLLKYHPNILKGRAGIFLGGLLILETFMKYYKIQTVTTSTGGIRHGALLAG